MWVIINFNLEDIAILGKKSKKKEIIELREKLKKINEDYIKNPKLKEELVELRRKHMPTGEDLNKVFNI